MNRTRKQPYYYINDIGELKTDVDNRSDRDKQRFKIGNYFLDEGQARLKQKEFLANLSKTQGIVNKLKSHMI